MATRTGCVGFFFFFFFFFFWIGLGWCLSTDIVHASHRPICRLSGLANCSLAFVDYTTGDVTYLYKSVRLARDDRRVCLPFSLPRSLSLFLCSLPLLLCRFHFPPNPLFLSRLRSASTPPSFPVRVCQGWDQGWLDKTERTHADSRNPPSPSLVTNAIACSYSVCRARREHALLYQQRRQGCVYRRHYQVR